jgi:HEAT repeats
VVMLEVAGAVSGRSCRAAASPYANWSTRNFVCIPVCTIRAQTTIIVHAQNLFDSSQIAQFDVTESLPINVQGSSENQLQAVFQPYVEELHSPDLLKRGEAANAITVLAAPFLEDVLMEMTKSSYASAAINALRNSGHCKDPGSSGDPGLRRAAIGNLGRAGDTTYLPALLSLMQSDDKQIRYAAAEAAGNLGGAQAVLQLAALACSADAETRLAGTHGLGEAQASPAVPVLIGLLLDSDENVRHAAVTGLWVLTHHAALDSNQWSDVTSMQSAAGVQKRWARWWSTHGKASKVHGMADCAPPESLD